MAAFNVNNPGSFSRHGPAASDTFNVSAADCAVLGLDGDDTFSGGAP